MPLYIRDSSVDDLAEQVRARLGARNKTEAVRMALRNELARDAATRPMRTKLEAIRKRAREERQRALRGDARSDPIRLGGTLNSESFRRGS